MHAVATLRLDMPDESRQGAGRSRADRAPQRAPRRAARRPGPVRVPADPSVPAALRRDVAVDQAVYTLALLASALAAALLIAPSMVHRLNFRRGNKERILFDANRLMVAGTLCTGHRHRLRRLSRRRRRPRRHARPVSCDGGLTDRLRGALARRCRWHVAASAKADRRSGLACRHAAAPARIPDVVEIVVEIPRGSRNKYEYDEEAHVYRLDRVLSSAVFYNFDYGFIEGTRAGDGDHTDALLVIDEPTFTGCHVWARPIGGLEMRDEKGFDFKVLCVAIGDCPPAAHRAAGAGPPAPPGRDRALLPDLQGARGQDRRDGRLARARRRARGPARRPRGVAARARGRQPGRLDGTDPPAADPSPRMPRVRRLFVAVPAAGRRRGCGRRRRRRGSGDAAAGRGARRPLGPPRRAAPDPALPRADAEPERIEPTIAAVERVGGRPAAHRHRAGRGRHVPGRRSPADDLDRLDRAVRRP